MLYVWLKVLHVLFVMAWVATVFYLPRIVVNMAEVGDVPQVQARLQLMGRRLVRFGHVMFGLAVIFGASIWIFIGITGGWLHAKLTLVALLLAYFIYFSKVMKRSPAQLPTSASLRWLNELPVVLLLGILYLVIAKPF
jgi:protoporphyrinogen IX oxidase